MSVILTSSDDKSFTVDLRVVKHSGTILGLLENVDAESLSEHPIPLMNVTGEILEKIIEWLAHHQNDVVVERDEWRKKVSGTIPQWDRDFMEQFDNDGLFHMLMGANYLDIRNLLDICTELISVQLKGKNTEQLRAHFGIINDFTPEEEAEMKKENNWNEI
ncbi:hypothetical protein PRIPAC_86625 [Pristionchus pacificus]|uniref:Skp1-related protein n=1 Tax=Pristionchus pacificus TaxID=54126 RepID=A0A454XZ27_PRIPA|nr:hypothetical protein PRIPAC_86625 [Pristionchus pacificus]|eukprot:PDM69037.1 hypothetical protein PRIPAC_47339 [Pristionchus pacificus]